MAENISKIDAEKILLAAYKRTSTVKDKISGNIIAVLQGDHKTYKYILLTGLLGKATNGRINPLALQAGAPIEGAYDARSLCHQVLVPFERDFMQSALGGSNEPFLNKPARFTHLSTLNAVRNGRDREILNLLIDIFTNISTSEAALEYLSVALEFLNLRIEELKKLQSTKISHEPTLIEIYDFIFRFLEKSFEGESSAIIVGALEKMYHYRFSKNYEIVAHKVNQSGASSKEVGDIDIFREGKFYYAIEVKDKTFTAYDLEHAFRKVQEAGGSKGQFIYGPSATFDRVSLDSKIKEFENENFMVLMQDIFTYARTMIFKIDVEEKQEFLDSIMETAIEINSKDETKLWIQFLLQDLGWK